MVELHSGFLGVLLVGAFGAGYLWGWWRKERQAFREWLDYQAYLGERRKAVSAKFKEGVR